MPPKICRIIREMWMIVCGQWELQLKLEEMIDSFLELIVCNFRHPANEQWNIHEQELYLMDPMNESYMNNTVIDNELKQWATYT